MNPEMNMVMLRHLLAVLVVLGVAVVLTRRGWTQPRRRAQPG